MNISCTYLLVISSTVLLSRLEYSMCYCSSDITVRTRKAATILMDLAQGCSGLAGRCGECYLRLRRHGRGHVVRVERAAGDAVQQLHDVAVPDGVRRPRHRQRRHVRPLHDPPVVHVLYTISRPTDDTLFSPVLQQLTLGTLALVYYKMSGEK